MIWLLIGLVTKNMSRKRNTSLVFIAQSCFAVPKIDKIMKNFIYYPIYPKNSKQNRASTNCSYINSYNN